MTRHPSFWVKWLPNAGRGMASFLIEAIVVLVLALAGVLVAAVALAVF